MPGLAEGRAVWAKPILPGTQAPERFDTHCRLRFTKLIHATARAVDRYS